MGKKVGIVIPSYNQGKYIEAAISSALENKKNADIEVAVMDGGSTDETVDIIQKYEMELKAWCSEPDGGQANAINKGISVLSDCDYYMWLNSDDVYENEYSVQKLIDYADENQFEVCYGLSHFVDEYGKITGEYPVEEFGYKKLGNRCYLSQPSVMFSRKAYKEVGKLDESLHMCMDYEYWMRLAQKYEFGFLREYIGSTRLYGETKTATMQHCHLQEAVKILQMYYGRVPMRWVVTKYLCEHPDSVFHKFPRRVLMLILFPYKGKII